MTRVAVIVFPGTNCMFETRDAVVAAGAEVTFLNWKATREDCSEFDAFVLPGGISYEDRVRAGVIAALNHAGRATLTHPTSPMGFLTEALKRPSHEKPYVLLPIGYPTDDCQVPQLQKKSLDELRIIIGD